MSRTVFLSSTGKDLSPYRAQVIEDLRGHDWFRLDAMEEWGARSRPPMHLCRERVAESQIFVGIIGHYRGWEPDGDNSLRSITEMEYDWAVDGKKPRLMFVAPDSFAGAAPSSDGDAKARQQAFRTRLMKAETVDQRCFGSAHALSAAVLKALYNELFYDIAGRAKAAPGAPPGQLNAAAMAGAVIADVAREKNLTLEEMQAQGLGPDEIEAFLTKQKLAATARIAHHKEAEAEARKDAALAAKKLGALAYPYDTGKALAAYAEAAELDPDDWEALWYLGKIQKRAGNLEGAKTSFERLIVLHPTLDNPYYIHWSYFRLGDVETDLGNRDTALSHYERGQALVRALIGSDPNNAQWQGDLAVSYDNIGDISAARGDRDGALKAYQDGQEIFKSLAARDPSNAEWQRGLSVNYDRVGDISSDRGDRDGALKAFNDGFDIRKQLAARDPNNAEWQRDLSVSYNKIGDISAARGDRDGALKAYQDGLDIAKQLAARDPNNATWQRDLSHWYNNIGDISAARGDRDGALKAFNDGLDIAKRLAARDPNNAEWQRDLSVWYGRVGDISAARGDRDGALKAYKDGQEIFKKLAARDPNNAEWQRDLSVSYSKIGDISADRGDRDAALKAFNDGLDIAKQLAARDPNNAEWQRDLSVSYNKIGDISAARGDRDGALKAFNDGLDIRKLLAARDPNNAEWQRDLSVSYNKIGDISAARGDRDGALKAFNDGLDIAKLLAARDPNNATWQTDLVVSAWKLAKAGAKDKRQHLASGLAILKRLDAEGKLTADQKGWIAAFEAALQTADKPAPWWKFWT